MKIVINSGRTVHTTAKGGVTGKEKDLSDSVRPEVKICRQNELIELPDAEAKSLIARGHARKYEPPKVVEVEPEKK
jgi:hypothetical protein